MNKVTAKHLVLVRHGESEGDVRRAMVNQPQRESLKKHPKDEEQTNKGHQQSLITGQWISKFILSANHFDAFDWQCTSPLLRTVQSAKSLDIPGNWQQDECLAERDRGDIQGMTKKQHEQEYPNNYKQMLQHPFHWTPPNGESLLRVSDRFNKLVNKFMQSSASSAIFMTHRDLLWAAHVPLDKIPVNHIEEIDTDNLHNARVMHYTNVNPYTDKVESESLDWKQSYTPWLDDVQQEPIEWVKI